jgi:uncharacterized protein GlcG (DUF336 family)
MSNSRPLPFFAALLGIALPCSAAELPKISVLPLELAQKAASAALSKCQSAGYKVSVAVVDQSGVARVLLRNDGASPHSADSSLRKAYTAATLRDPTQKFAEMIAKNPEVQGLRDINPSMLILGGGLPIRFGDEIVGGIGVGGAPGAKLDESCARSGLESIGAYPYTTP